MTDNLPTWYLVVMSILGLGMAALLVLLVKYSWILRRQTRAYEREDHLKDIHPLSQLHMNTLKDLVRHNMVVVDEEKYAVMEEMCRRFTERVDQEAAEVKQ